jgi:hypothetical protein
VNICSLIREVSYRLCKNAFLKIFRGYYTVIFFGRNLFEMGESAQ